MMPTVTGSRPVGAGFRDTDDLGIAFMLESLLLTRLWQPQGRRDARDGRAEFVCCTVDPVVVAEAIGHGGHSPLSTLPLMQLSLQPLVSNQGVRALFDNQIPLN